MTDEWNTTCSSFWGGGGVLTLNNKNDYECIKAEISGLVAVSAFTNAIFGQKTGIMKIWNLNMYNNVFFCTFYHLLKLPTRL